MDIKYIEEDFISRVKEVLEKEDFSSMKEEEDFEPYNIAEILNEEQYFSEKGYWESGSNKLVFVPFKEIFDKVLKIILLDYEISDEVSIYNESIEKDLEDFFAPSYPFFELEIDNLKLKCYFQEALFTSRLDEMKKENCVHIDIKKLSKQNRTIYSKYQHYFKEGFIMSLLSTTSPIVSLKLLTFLNKNSINDLHNSNFTFKDSKLVIFDYEGFRQ